jgi:hypothetical protein
MGARVLILVFLVAGCQKESKLYCGMHLNDIANCGYADAGIDARPACMSDMDCASTPLAPHCELGAHVCVECFDDTHCAANADKKFCDLDTFLCTTCVKNSDCASGACLPNGVCGDDNNVAYVDAAAPAGNTQCTMAAPCLTITKGLATGKPYILVRGAISDTVAISGKSVTIIGEPGASVTRPMAGVVMTITAGADVAIYDLTVIGNGEKGIAIDMGSTVHLVRVTVTNCNGKDHRAIEAKTATLIMSRCTVYANIGGGILTDANTTYNITNSFIYRNGDDASAVGGLSLGATSAGLRRFEFNTIADNRAKAAPDVGGVHCGGGVPAPNNIIARNSVGGLLGGLTANTDATGGCDFSQSMIASDVATFSFVMPDGTGPWDYHVMAGSMAIDRGVTSDITVDFDGQPRPQNTKFDVGADEYKP